MLKPTNRHNLMWHCVNSRAANPIASATSIVMAALTAAPVLDLDCVSRWTTACTIATSTPRRS
jgi:hypothetical protein